MSQASNKLGWCLNKAKKELEETGLHRGLVKIEEDLDLFVIPHCLRWLGCFASTRHYRGYHKH